jgi:hypothetical protein
MHHHVDEHWDVDVGADEVTTPRRKHNTTKVFISSRWSIEDNLEDEEDIVGKCYL